MTDPRSSPDRSRRARRQTEVPRHLGLAQERGLIQTGRAPPGTPSLLGGPGRPHNEVKVRRYAGTFFRHARLYVTALILLFLATLVGAYQFSSTRYEVTARIWIDKPVLAGVANPTGQD